MDSLKQIMYGVTDFARMRSENAYFVDRTGLIRELEKTSYAMFLRPRRFGKSLWCAILQAYYDVDYAARFDELFGGLDIGRNPTAERGKYLFLNFNFSQVAKASDLVQASFNDCCSERLDVFVSRHAGLLPPGTAETVRAKRTCHEKLNALTTHLAGSGLRLYVVIDARHQEIIRAMLRLRQKFVPYIVACVKETGRTGEPMMRSLEYNFPGRGYETITDQFMMGEKLLVAPQVVKDATSRTVVIPPGTWKADDGTTVTGPKTITVETPLERLPHFVKQ